MKIGIFGGTFDPIHLGHLIAAEECRDLLKLDKILLIPAKIPPHKMTKTITNSFHRMNMLQSAISDYPFLEVSAAEINRPGPSYTIDTLDELQTRGSLTLIMGLDSFYEIDTWRRYREILKKYRLAVAMRPGTHIIETHRLPEDIQVYFPDRVINYLAGTPDEKSLNNPDWQICFLPIPGLKISASEIRNRVQENRTIRFLVPPAVRKYITAHSLYTDQ